MVSIPTGTDFTQQMIDTCQQTGAAMNQLTAESEQPFSGRTPQQNRAVSSQDPAVTSTLTQQTVFTSQPNTQMSQVT